TLSSAAQTIVDIESLFQDINLYTSFAHARFEELSQDTFRSTLEPGDVHDTLAPNGPIEPCPTARVQGVLAASHRFSCDRDTRAPCVCVPGRGSRARRVRLHVRVDSGGPGTSRRRIRTNARPPALPPPACPRSPPSLTP
ncbi:hypothetical protein B0H11DRAFT_1720034, partial [Mycena galericulata]